MKKKLCALALALVTAFACTPFTACGKKEDTSHTIYFYHTMGSELRDVLDIYVKEFESMYPGWKIKATQEGDYDGVRDKITSALNVGNQPDMAYCYPDHVAAYNLAKAVRTLDDFIDSTEQTTYTFTNDDGTTETKTDIVGLTQAQKDDFVPGYYEEGRQFGDGKMYTMPFSKSTEVLFYNKTFFKDNNIQVPTTWDEMEAVCQKIKDLDKGDKKTYIPLGYDSEANWFITMTEQLNTPYTSATKPYYLFDNDANKAFVKKFANWYANGYVTTKALNSDKYTSYLFTETKKGEMRSFMSIGSTAGAKKQRPTRVDNKYPFEVGITTIPQMDKSNPKVISQGPSVCIFKNRKNPEKEKMAWLFLKYLTTSADFQVEFALASGYIPVLKSAADHPVYAQKFAELEQAIAKGNGNDYIEILSAKVCMEQANAYYTSPAFGGSSKARDEVGKLMQKLLISKDIDSDIDKAFKDAVYNCEINYNK